MKPKKEWVAIELNILGEKEENLNEIQRDFRKHVPDIEIFIPIHWNDDLQYQKKVCLLQGYIFVTGIEDPREYFALESSKYVAGIVAHENSAGRSPDLISNLEIERLKKKLEKLIKKDFKEDDEVVILDGDYRNLHGKILSVLNESEVSIQILGIKSADVIVRIQKVYLEKFEPVPLE